MTLKTWVCHLMRTAIHHKITVSNVIQLMPKSQIKLPLLSHMPANNVYTLSEALDMPISKVKLFLSTGAILACFPS